MLKLILYDFIIIVLFFLNAGENPERFVSHVPVNCQVLSELGAVDCLIEAAIVRDSVGCQCWKNLREGVGYGLDD